MSVGRPTRLALATAILAIVGTTRSVAQQPAPLAACSAPKGTSQDVERRSVYVPMADRVRLATDIFLPKDLKPGTKLPTIFVSTRYWRGQDGQEPGTSEKFWIDRGYAYVYSDVRGTGASFGQWYYPWSPQEVKDIGALAKWIAQQPWSDGRVGTIGTSYTGNTAQLAAAYGAPAVKAVIPRFMDFDVYADLTFPGGVVNRMLIEDWGTMIYAMDMNEKRGNPARGVRPVDGDEDGKLMGAVMVDHKKNPPLKEITNTVIYRDEIVKQFGNVSNDAAGSYRHKAAIEASRIPIFGWASWLDAGTAQGVINRFRTWSNPQITVIGPWSHGGGHHTDPFRPADTATDPAPEVQQDQALCFFEQYVRGKPQGLGERAIIYYTLGEGKWKKTSVWPVAGTSMQRWYFGPSNTLTGMEPTAEDGKDEYKVDFDATTGKQNRWNTQLGGFDVIYPDRADDDKRLLTYTSRQLGRDLEVTGSAIVTLEVATTATDGNFIVYLEDVGPDGKVTYIQEGHLRGIHRKISTEPPPYKILYPHHTFKKKDSQPMVPGQVTTLKFQLLPTSVLFKSGHRIRIAVAGADKDTFLRNPAQGDVTLSVSRTKGRPSYIDLPVLIR